MPRPHRSHRNHGRRPEQAWRHHQGLERRLARSHMFAVILSIVFLFQLAGLFGLIFGRIDLFGSPRDGDFRWFASWWLGFIAVSWAGRIVARRYARRIIGPIKEMSIAARTLAAGNYSVRVPKPFETELADLAGDINSLARRARADRTPTPTADRRRRPRTANAAADHRGLDGSAHGRSGGAVR